MIPRNRDDLQYLCFSSDERSATKARMHGSEEGSRKEVGEEGTSQEGCKEVGEEVGEEEVVELPIKIESPH